MIKKHTYLIPADSCGVWWVSVFHVYKGDLEKLLCGDFVKVSVKVTKPKNRVKKKKIKSNIKRLKKEYKKRWILFKFQINNIVLLKKRMTPRGKNLMGPVNRILNVKNLCLLFR